ncbi:hypothetical protein DANISAUR_74 [Proteus phage vB_PmiS_DanisaurMW]|nr:hypothetical protein DANISAUR_74 [Proteus phage vB_PmiS_DanisaurMW]
MGECERVRAWGGGVGWVGAGATAWIERRPRTRKAPHECEALRVDCVGRLPDC